MPKNKRAQKRPSSVDVARLAKVSQATVSRVLNHPEKVEATTRERVYAAITQLGYVPNQNARQLVSGRSNVITLISGPLENPFFVDSTAAIVEHATERGYKVNILFANDVDIHEIYKLALAQRPDGLIMSCILYDDPIFEQLKELNIPFISFNRRHQEKLNYVEFDNFLAGRMVCQWLKMKGYQSLFWVGGNLKASTFLYRFNGFIETYRQLYLADLTSDIIYQAEHLDEEILLSQIMQWYAQTPGKKAIAAATDSIALQLLNLLKNKGIHCPKEIGIMGIDNVELAQHAYIELTTVGTSHNLGEVAIKLLIDQIEMHDTQNIAITLQPEVFDRGTLRP